MAPLTKRGESQAIKYGLCLRDRMITPDVVLGSGAVRAQSTGTIALANAGLLATIRVDERLQEIDMGIYEGRLRTEVYTDEVSDALNAAGLDGHLPTAESIRDVQNRMWEALLDGHRSLPDGTLLIFGHGLAIRAVAGKILGLDKQGILKRLSTDNVSETKIEITSPDNAKIHYVGKNVIAM